MHALSAIFPPSSAAVANNDGNKMAESAYIIT